jgi:hypothetical protein
MEGEKNMVENRIIKVSEVPATIMGRKDEAVAGMEWEADLQAVITVGIKASGSSMAVRCKGTMEGIIVPVTTRTTREATNWQPRLAYMNETISAK